ncbi:MAG: hypothetical protein GXX09_00170 [Syntrophomonadaceae bacterium]|nr:hypothetical protein [Syntrophomonadaceae bacterium]
MGSVTIFAGGFGSGKTETALNCALELSRYHKRVVLADLDLVNPYFCSRELEQTLHEHGIKLLAPIEQLRFGDVPQVPSEVVGYLGMDNEMVFDVGGDEVGACVFGYLRSYFASRTYEMLLVVNPFRPFAETLEKVAGLKAALEKASRLNFTGIVSNPNLAVETDIDTIVAGHRRVEEYARRLDLPVKFLVVEADLYGPLQQKRLGVTLKPIRLYLRPEWL